MHTSSSVPQASRVLITQVASLLVFVALPIAPALATAPPSYQHAVAGDVVTLPLEQLRPTQGAIGYDQLAATLGRWQGDFQRPTWRDDPKEQLSYLRKTVGKKFDDYCEANGAGGLATTSLNTAASLQSAKLNQTNSFQCAQPFATHTADLKTIVIGPDGQPYLTDGHHTFSAFWEAADGGPKLPVWVRVVANYRHTASLSVFWQNLTAANHTWLRDGNNQPISPSALPRHVGKQSPNNPRGLANDPYRSLVYFTRGLGYDNAQVPEFAEFLWADWLRGQLKLPLPPAALKPENMTAYQVRQALLAHQDTVRDAADIMRATPSNTPIFKQLTARDLGQIPSSQSPRAQAELNDRLNQLIRSDQTHQGKPRVGGKLWYSVNQTLCGPPRTGTACWGY